MANSRPKPRKRVAQRGVIYGRQSKTKDGSESLDTQVDACLQTAEHHKIEVVDTILEPPSTSAYKDRGRVRPRFPEVLELIRSGEIDCVIAYKTDRLSRGGGIGWAPLVEAAEEANLDVDRFVLIAGNGFMSEFELGIRATMDREESKKTSERICDFKERHAAAGKPWGGGRRPFGYVYDKTDKTLTIEPTEAEMVREAAARLLAGDGVNAICRDWNNARRLSALGKEWRAGTLRNVLLRASLAGQREHNGEIVGPGTWEPILDRATWEKVRDLLKDPSRAQVPSYRENVLSRIIRCGKCGCTLTIAPVQGKDRYRCQPSPGKPNCGGVVIVQADVESLVVEAMFQRLDTPKLAHVKESREVATDEAEVSATIATNEARLVELAEMWGAGEVSRPEYLAARKTIEGKLDAARSVLRRSRPKQAPELAQAPSVLRAAWPDLSLDRRRAVVQSVIDRVTIAPGVRGRNKFDPERVDVEWKV